MPTGNRTVDQAIEAHGGEARWREVSAIDTSWTFHGTMFKIRLREAQLKDLHARISTTEPRVVVDPFAGRSATGTFTPTRLELVEQDGRMTSLENPRDAFKRPRTIVWWNDLEMLYFAGYVLWNYAQLPFLLLKPGLVIEDAGTTRKQGETWTKVRVTFPATLPTHSPRQTFYFGPDGLLRRHDYHVGILSRLARGARYIHANQVIDGLTLPSRIEIKLGLVGESYAPFPALGWVEFDGTRVE